MKKIKLITTEQYAAMPKAERAVYDVVAKSIKPGKNIWIRKARNGFHELQPKYAELWDYTYADIIELKQAFAGNDSLELIKQIGRVVYGIEHTDIQQISYINVATGLFAWVFKEFEAMLQAETNKLQYTPDEKEKTAGIDNLADFGHFPAIDSLAGGDITKHDEILKTPYHMVFQKLAYQHTVNQIQKKLIENAGK
jgi:hypothetical protein